MPGFYFPQLAFYYLQKKGQLFYIVQREYVYIIYLLFTECYACVTANGLLLIYVSIFQQSLCKYETIFPMTPYKGRHNPPGLCAKMTSMPKIIYRSLLKDLLLTFFVTLAFLNSILMMEKILRLSRLLSGVGATVADMVRIIIYLQPQLLMLTIPMSLLLSVLLVYGRMHLDSEIIVLKAAGMDYPGISFPVMIFGFLCFLASIAVSFYLGPSSSVRLREEITKIIAVRSTLAIEEGTFNTSFKDLVILVKGKKSADTLEDIFIYDTRSKEEPRILMAKEGKIFMQNDSTIGLYLQNGYMNISKGSNSTELFFKAYKMALYLDAQSSSPKKIELTPMQLFHGAKNADTGRARTSFYLEFHRRLSLPFVCLILVFLGPPLSSMSGKSGRLGGLAIGLFVFTLYYMTLIYGENLAAASRIPHYAGAWAATLILGVFAFVMFKSESNR
jgi:lipopolysaccharide export system permease protein